MVEKKKLVKKKEEKEERKKAHASTKKVEKKKETKKVEHKAAVHTHKAEATKEEGAKDDKKAVESKKVEVKVVKKAVAYANGFSLRISPKHAKAICKVLKGKSPDQAVKRLEDVIAEKRAIPMAGLEVGHQKGRGLAGARFPKNACKEIIAIVKQAGANASTVSIDNPVITQAISNRAAAPFRRGGRKAKRTHIKIEVKDKSKLVKRKKA